jgi:hypothetical protein
LSAILDIKDAVYALLDTALTVPVVWGVNERDTEFVAVWQGSSESEPVVFGPVPPPLDERFEITLVIQALTPSGRDMRAAEVRAWEIHNDTVAALRSDLSLDGVTLFTTPAKSKQEFIQTEQRQGTRITLTFSGTARI